MSQKRVFIFIATLCAVCALFFVFAFDGSGPSAPRASATGTFVATGGSLVVGTEVAISQTNVGSWKAFATNDSRSWVTARTVAGGLDKQLYYDGVQQLGANKMIITIVDTNITTADAFTHQICDWVSSDNVSNPADANCTGGGWRNLPSLGTSYINVSAATRTYEIFDGYFWSPSTPGVTISTPISNFIRSGNGRVLIRVYSTATTTTQHSLERATVEVAVDPIYDVATFTNTSGGLFVGALNRMIVSDNSKIVATMPGANSPIDSRFTFENVKTYSGANTIMINHEVCATSALLTHTVSLWNFQTSSWTVYPKTITPTVCGTDIDSILTFNSTSIAGFNIGDYISGGQIRMRILTAGPSSIFNIQYDHVMAMIGSVNTDTALCEISWGTNAANDCSATRTTEDFRTAIPTSATWDITSVAEYLDSDFYGGDNDDDATSGEHSVSLNISVPVVPSSGTLVTGIHYAAKFLSGNASMRLDPSVRDYSAQVGVSGWVDTPGADSSLSATVYTFADSWSLAELQSGAPFYINKDTGLMNFRLRTSASTLTASSATSRIDFIMGSIRWVEHSNLETINPFGPVTGASLITGTETATGVNNMGSWRGVFGNDANTWVFNRTASGAEAHFYFNNVQSHGANKLQITTEAGNTLAGSETFVYEICDWVNSAAVTNPADANCTGGGWRNLHPRGTAGAGFTGVSSVNRNFEIFDGYFVNRSGASPGVVVSTPISNFIRSSDGRVLVRIYSTNNSSNGISVDVMSVEVAVDPVYEPVGISVASGGASTGYLSDLSGITVTGINGSDGNKVVIPQAGALTGVDVSYTFENVELANGFNTILVSPEVCATSASMTFITYLWNYSNSSWVSNGITTVPTVCGTDTEYAFAFNPYTIAGFNINNFVSSSGQMRLRFLSANGVAATPSIQFDRIYVMLGSVNASTSSCEISWGTGTASDCTNTRTVNESKLAAPSTSVWSSTSVTEYNQANAWPYDSDEDATVGESANSVAIGFNTVLPQYSSATGIHYAIKHRSGSASLTWEPQFKTLDAQIGTAGWYSTPGADNNASATGYNWFDSWIASKVSIAPMHIYNAVTGDLSMRVRTNTTATTTSVISSLDYIMTSLRWVTDNAPVISITVDDGNISYGYVPIAGSKDTTASGVNDTQNVLNDGTASVDLNIKGFDTACWSLAGLIGANQYAHEFSTNAGASWASLSTSYQSFATSINPSSDQDVDFRITLPSSTPCLTQQSAQVTVQAVEI